MSDVKIEDLSPVPFFAHFLEGQFSRNLTTREMKVLRGGSSTTLAFPSDQEGAPAGELPDIRDLIRRASEGAGQVPSYPLPGNQVTLAYPSDGESAPLPL